MRINTDHLGYKLISGKLKERRVHSEQLNKFLAGFFDAIDGRVARMTNSTSDFGMELDSLADVISFGIAPCILVDSS